jgi:prepilin-type N-terminal cleavage/methylation domain-containing protein
MNTPTSDFRTSNLKHSALRIPNSEFRLGFTLVELLIVITVIGILVGLLLPAINGAMSSARELAMRTEMVQIEQAVESFRTEYGFYPPSFEQFNRSPAGGVGHPGLSAFLRYLNRIAPSHQESTVFPDVGSGVGGVRIVAWWNKIGRHLDDQSSLVFWLSGLCKSKQFPITGGSDGLIEPFNGPAQFIATPSGPIEIERDVRFEFQPGQLTYGVGPDVIGARDVAATNISRVNDDSDVLDPVDFRELDLINVGTEFATVAAYKQPNGPSNGDLIYRYRDAASYFYPPFAYLTDAVPSVMRDIDFDGAADDTVPDPEVFVNPKTFQLISFGLDGDPGVPLNPMGAGAIEHQRALVFSTDSNFIKFGYDNMANFADGRLELFVIENE